MERENEIWMYADTPDVPDDVSEWTWVDCSEE